MSPVLRFASLHLVKVLLLCTVVCRSAPSASIPFHEHSLSVDGNPRIPVLRAESRDAARSAGVFVLRTDEETIVRRRLFATDVVDCSTADTFARVMHLRGAGKSKSRGGKSKKRAPENEGDASANDLESRIQERISADILKQTPPGSPAKASSRKEAEEDSSVEIEGLRWRRGGTDSKAILSKIRDGGFDRDVLEDAMPYLDSAEVDEWGDMYGGGGDSDEGERSSEE
eukprot:34513-Rhodomonas_salina.2